MPNGLQYHYHWKNACNFFFRTPGEPMDAELSGPPSAELTLAVLPEEHGLASDQSAEQDDSDSDWLPEEDSEVR